MEKLSRLSLVGSVIGAGAGGHKTALYQCVCGVTKRVRMDRVRRGVILSCGCLRRETTSKTFSTHKMTGTGEHNSWTAMKQRCYYTASKQYPDYGGRGIKVCPEWVDSFEQFLLDMGRKPTGKHTLDRINNNADYCKANCRWATSLVQSLNQRRYNGKHDKRIEELMEKEKK